MVVHEWTATKTVKKISDCSTKVNVEYISAIGNTPLIAAMRCYVISKLGDIVDLSEYFAHPSDLYSINNCYMTAKLTKAETPHTHWCTICGVD